MLKRILFIVFCALFYLLAAAQSVETIGNKEAINKVKILKSINTLYN